MYLSADLLYFSWPTCGYILSVNEKIRNKEENYFIASGLLKKICTNPKGVQAVLKMTAMLKRLLALVDEPTKKVIPGNRYGYVLPKLIASF